MPIPQDYAKNVIDGVAVKLREFENSEFMLLISDSEDKTFYRSDGRSLTRISYLQIQLNLIANTFIHELQQIKDVNVFDDVSTTLAMVHRIRMHVQMLYQARVQDEERYSL